MGWCVSHECVDVISVTSGSRRDADVTSPNLPVRRSLFDPYWFVRLSKVEGRMLRHCRGVIGEGGDICSF
jgi:hypothetical protein